MRVRPKASVAAKGQGAAIGLALCMGLPGAALAQAPIAYGETISGRLEQTDPTDALGNPFDEYAFMGTAGDVVRATVRSADFEAIVLLRALEPRALLVYDHGMPDDETGDPDAELLFTLTRDGPHMVEIGSYFGIESGGYEVTLERLP